MITTFITSDLKARTRNAGMHAAHGARMAGEQVKTGAAALGGALLGRWLSGDDDRGADHQPLTSRFIRQISHEIEMQVEEGADLPSAVASALRGRAPILLEPRHRTSSWMTGSWMKGAAAVVLFGVGANYAFKWITGRSLAERLRASFSHEEAGREAAYRPVHGTAGARVPDAKAATPRTTPLYTAGDGHSVGM